MPMGMMVEQGGNVVSAILHAALDFDAVVIGAIREPLFERVLFGTVPEHIAERCVRTVIMVKSTSHPLTSSVRRVARAVTGQNGHMPELSAVEEAEHDDTVTR